MLVLCSTLQVNALALDYCLYILILCLISYIDGSMIIAVIGYCIVLIYFINFLHVVSRGSCGESVGFSSSAFVPVNHTFVPVNHTRVSHCFSPQLGTPSFLCSSPVIFRTSLQKNPEMDGQDICPGSDDNEDVPIGYFVITDDSANMAVFHQ